MKIILLILIVAIYYSNCATSQNLKFSGYTISFSSKNLISDSEWSNSEKLDVNFKIKGNKIKIKTYPVKTQG